MALGFGAYNGFPFKFGGGDSIVEIEHQALLDAYAPGWDDSEGTENWSECYAYAVAISAVWAINKRLANQLIPMRMLEFLRVWEESCTLRPSRTDTDVERRQRVAGKLRGLVNNAIGDITQAAAESLAENFEALLTVDPANDVTYWPGINPGPPGYEWASTKAIIGVRMNENGLSNARFFAKRSAVVNLLDSLLPTWMTLAVGTGDTFTINQGVIAKTFL